MGWGGSLESGGGGGGPGPVVSNFQPPEGTPIQPGTALTFDVTGPNDFVALVISVHYEQTGATEVVFNQDGFTANFAPTGGFLGSEQQPITDGFHFLIRRRGGWPFSPSIVVEGGDNVGNPVTQ